MGKTGDVAACLTVICRKPALYPVDSRYSISASRKNGSGQGWGGQVGVGSSERRWDSSPALPFAIWKMPGKLQYKWLLTSDISWPGAAHHWDIHAHSPHGANASREYSSVCWCRGSPHPHSRAKI